VRREKVNSDALVFLEQIRHSRLGDPSGVVFKLNLKEWTTVLGLIEDDF